MPMKQRPVERISFSFIRTRLGIRLGLLKSGASRIDTDEELSEVLKQIFLTLFSKERLDDILHGEPLFRRELEGLTDINMSRKAVIRQVDRLN